MDIYLGRPLTLRCTLMPPSQVLELLAAYFALKSFRTQVTNKHVKLMIDNTTAVAVINHMGTNHSHNYNVLATKFWNFCYENRIWITACHIPGEDNVEADRESRCFFKQDAECCQGNA